MKPGGKPAFGERERTFDCGDVPVCAKLADEHPPLAAERQGERVADHKLDLAVRLLRAPHHGGAVHVQHAVAQGRKRRGERSRAASKVGHALRGVLRNAVRHISAVLGKIALCVIQCGVPAYGCLLCAVCSGAPYKMRKIT